MAVDRNSVFDFIIEGPLGDFFLRTLLFEDFGEGRRTGISLGGAAAIALPQPAPAPVPVPPRGPAQIIKFPVPQTQAPPPSLGKVLLTRGSILTGAAAVLAELVRIIQQKNIDREFREAEAAFELEKRQRALKRPIPTIIINDRVPDPVVDPQRITLPQPLPLPEIIFDPLPEIPSAPVKLPEPVVPVPEIPAPTPAIPSPAPVPAPAPATTPGRTPRVLPPITPGPSVFPIGFPVSFPVSQPIGRPATNPANLTNIEPSVLTSEFANVGVIELPQPQPSLASNPNQCEQVQRRRRRKGKCREGFFIERPGSTDYITWRENECDTVDSPF